MTQERKRILSITIKHMIDESPDTSYLGEYSSTRESEYSIDRRHDIDCTINQRPTAVLDQLERSISYLNTQTYAPIPDDEAEAIQDAQNILIEAQDEVKECDCGGRGIDSRSYPYFNPPPVDNYLGTPPDELRKYCLQDLERMESLNNQQWYYMGIRAQAEVQLTGDVVQRITSGGCWGIESDSGKDDIAEVDQEELSALKAELHALGFSKRAITAACKGGVPCRQ